VATQPCWNSTERFDGAKLTTEQLAVTQAELMTASPEGGRTNSVLPWPRLNGTSPNFRQKVPSARVVVQEQPWRPRWARNLTPSNVWAFIFPVGRPHWFPTALMTITPRPKWPGCRRSWFCNPCGKDGSINPALLYAARAAGATEIYRVGGAQAIAALAYGTSNHTPGAEDLRTGQMAYVVTAKRLLVGQCRHRFAAWSERAPGVGRRNCHS